MRKLLILLLLSLSVSTWAATPVPVHIPVGEKLTYSIYFHLGFIWSKAGYGELTFDKEQRKGQTQYHGQLAAKSLSIVEHIMKVRDTLDCWFDDDMIPAEFRKGTHEGSYNAVAHNVYRPMGIKRSAANTSVSVDSTRVTVDRWKKKGKDQATNTHIDNTNKGVAYDMLSVFYSVRHLDYSKMQKGKKMKFVCYDGIKCQTINVTYGGEESCELRSGKTYKSYLIDLTFDTKDEKATPLKVWLSKDADHRPVKAVIALKRIGSVQCEINE